MLAKSLDPSLVVKGHRVGDGAVAVKDQAADVWGHFGHVRKRRIVPTPRVAAIPLPCAEETYLIAGGKPRRGVGSCGVPGAIAPAAGPAGRLRWIWSGRVSLALGHCL